MIPFDIRPLEQRDRDWVRQVLTERWASPRIVTRGRIHQADELPGFVALDPTDYLGLATYSITANQCELVSLDSLSERRGIGTALIHALTATARTAGCQRLWLITTNDNLPALRFYQKRGFVFAALHANALAHSRRLKPEIPPIGRDDIPLRDELELELRL